MTVRGTADRVNQSEEFDAEYSVLFDTSVSPRVEANQYAQSMCWEYSYTHV